MFPYISLSYCLFISISLLLYYCLTVFLSILSLSLTGATTSQLCINYANETLQQQFNQYIFKMEQIEYQREQINWSFIEFPDNQDCLDLIEHRVSGILAMLDDECRLPKAADEKLAARMYKAYEEQPRFSASAAQKRDFRFCVRHYAGAVVYSAVSFVEKNKDELPKEATFLLQGSSVPLLCALFSEPRAGTGTGSGSGSWTGTGSPQGKVLNVGVQVPIKPSSSML
jgi:myosin heavy subunit